jgi:phosphotriesterase-related protein
MSVMTVLGEIGVDELGIVLPHEHIMLDLRNQFAPVREASQIALSEQRVHIGNLDILSRNPLAVKDNLVLNDLEVAERELMEFKKAGGRTVAEATSRGAGRDPLALRGLAHAVGINIIAGCGYFTYDTHPSDMEAKSVQTIKEEMLRDIREGIDGTGVKSGVIGEIGTSEKLHANEKKALIAASQVQAETGLGLHVHTEPWGNERLNVLKIVAAEGGDLRKVVINHIDVKREFDLEELKEIMRQGAFIEFDNFGKEYYVDSRNRGLLAGPFAHDIERVQVIKELIDAGFADRILITNDLCFKTMLHRYGGWGYDHIVTHIVPMLLEVGVTRQQVDTLIVENPKAFLDPEQTRRTP